MTSTLATRQGLLTRSGNRLSTIIQEESETINAYVHSSMEAAEISALRKRIRTAKTAIGTETNKLEAAMEKFSETVDRNIDNLFKFNYLLDALEEDVRRICFEVSGSTYQLVIEHLKEKYGDKQALIDQLLKNLHGARARTDSLEDQEALCEQIHSITSQLTLKGEHVDNVFLQKKLLAKFSVDVQRHILRQKTQFKNEGNWSTAALLSAAREHINTELKINRQVEHSLGSGKMEKTNAGKE